MGRDKDSRNFQDNKDTAARENELISAASAVSADLPGEHNVRIAKFDGATGNAAVVASESAPAEQANYIQRALEHVRQISTALGFAATQPAEFMADPHIQMTGSGAVAVHLQQQYKGISIFQAAQTVRFAPDGALKETAGTSVTVDQEQSVTPRLSVEEAALLAARYVAEPTQDELDANMTDQFGEPLEPPHVNVDGFSPKVVMRYMDTPNQPTVLEAGPFAENIRANLTWFPLDDKLRLSWEFVFTMPDYNGQYRTIVDATSGDILYCHQLVDTVRVQGNVYVADGDNPRQQVDFPGALADYNLPLPNDLPPVFPDPWVKDNTTAGNSVRATLWDNNGPQQVNVQGTLQNNVLTFNPVDEDGDEQKVLNIFYLNCFMHDFFYLLGFREEDGNFQLDNLARGGLASDPVEARAYRGAVWGTASMATPNEGLSPVMKMGLVTSTNRHTAFDSSVVYHEFTHGVTNRLVGGPMNIRALEMPQSGGMGEGWGDYIACTVNKSTVVGAWVVNKADGLRAFAYDSNFPDGFGDLGKGRYTEVHDIGEIWCATLMEMNREIGETLALQLVVSALKLSPSNPSFLDMRDAILTELENRLAAGILSASEHAAARRGIWKAFAKFGMGVNARSNGASLFGIQADTTMPPDTTDPTGEHVSIGATPELAIPDNNPNGVSSTLSVVQNGSIANLTVSVDIQHPYRGDLRVSLVPPSGNTIVLHNRAGERTRDLIRSYATNNTAALAALVGQQTRGNWTLNVADLAPLDRGTFRNWNLAINLEDTLEGDTGTNGKEEKPVATAAKPEATASKARQSTRNGKSSTSRDAERNKPKPAPKKTK